MFFSHNQGDLRELSRKGFDVMFLSHAESILYGEFAQALSELAIALDNLSLPITEIIGSGGGETKFTQRLRRSLADMGWQKHNFEIVKVVDGQPRESSSHEVDHVRRAEAGVLACEIEWNNKDPFFDRDLENFKRLHAEGAISVGILITRGSTLQNALFQAVLTFAQSRNIQSFEDLAYHGVVPTPKQRKAIEKKLAGGRVSFAEAWTQNFVSNKYGQASTHWEKLMLRVMRGVGNPCPLLLIGLPADMIAIDNQTVEPIDEDELDQDTLI
ncbi:BglII/BstYI family type II restriction endonuclease [Stutzerimonas stutzeri]|uniref:BglII/BstYI family type II restriction endonuclease n=1 Tax=Stutzerimonas stutzeri TaxID=316 RepID=UPI0024469B7A|nr:BglII/BstYI family type II restriction endonuclease [Stutzerimonas stutzeri]MDH0084284.1 restriction endonuclease [Stutzerimonas stutzeri]